MEDKVGFVSELGEVLRKYSREDVKKLEYWREGDSETVKIHFENGYVKPIDVSGDSCIAIMSDVYKALL